MNFCPHGQRLLRIINLIIIISSPGVAHAAPFPDKQLIAAIPQGTIESIAPEFPVEKAPRFPAVKFKNANTRELITLEMFDDSGTLQKKAVRQFWRLMRCHHTGAIRSINPVLTQDVYQISRHYEGRTIIIYSGYRARRVSKTRGSYHVKGMAIDLAVEGVSTRALRNYLRQTFSPAGIGFYPRRPFVHFDVRDHNSYWVDISRAGKKAKYLSKHRTMRRKKHS